MQVKQSKKKDKQDQHPTGLLSSTTHLLFEDPVSSEIVDNKFNERTVANFLNLDCPCQSLVILRQGSSNNKSFKFQNSNPLPSKKKKRTAIHLQSKRTDSRIYCSEDADSQAPLI